MLLPKTIKAVLVGVVLGVVLSHLVQLVWLRTTTEVPCRPSSVGGEATSNGERAFTNLRRDGQEADGYHVDDALSEVVASLQLTSEAAEEQMQRHGDVFAQRRSPVALVPAAARFRQRRVLMSAVVTSVSRIANGHTSALHETWGVEASHVVYFAERSVPAPALPVGLNLVQLDALDSATTWDEKQLAVVRHLSAMHSDSLRETERFDWFLVTGDELYVVSGVLENRLNQLDASLPTCLGISKGEESSCFGAVFSKELMVRLGACLSRGGNEAVSSVMACVAAVGTSCVEGDEDEGWFSVDSQTLPLASLPLHRAAVFYPVVTKALFYMVHASLKQLQYNVSLTMAQEASETIRDIMPLLPHQHRFTVPPIPQASFQPTPTSCATTLETRYVSKNRYDVSFWEYFNQTRLMGVWQESPSVGIVGDVREEAKLMLFKAIHHVTQLQEGGEKLVFDHVENGYRRVDATRGSEYVLDLVFRCEASQQLAPVRKRVTLVRPYHEDIIPAIPPVEPSPTVNLILVLSGLADRLERFLTSYEEASSDGVTLTVVLYESPDSHVAKKVLAERAIRNPSSRIRVVDGAGRFARGAGLHVASEKFPGDHILFFVDVDLNVSAQAIRRCRLNAVRGQRVYFPVFFKMYNLSFVERHFRGVARYLIARHNGHWAHYSYGPVCIYADDYRKAGGYEIAAEGWGNEDVDFLERTLKAGLEPFRTPDPGLIHNWHPKVCDRRAIADNRTYEDCLRSRNENLADRIELANYVFSQEAGRLRSNATGFH